jgi:threonine dehydratase
VEAVIVPVGGGGLISGISVALKNLIPKVRIVGVQSTKAPSMLLSLKKKRIIETESARSIADGISIKRVGELPFEIARNYVDDVLTVEDNEIEEALLLLTERKRVVVEGAGAAGLAGLLRRKRDFKGENTVIVVSGGNIDINFLAKIIERGLVKNGRLLRLDLELPDIPGALGKLTTLLGVVKGNIIQIFHDRYSTKIPIDKAIVEISLETRNFDHQQEIIELLRENGYKPKEVG